eukprot:gb/GECG01013916.1/.p1 GENE.gb/GECG01013916.1/~~gb/GECG01013916.1/.p1  ORF type:complete len:102 (+),score=8.41 gb/GECG01013916.1/:1-306(+)
MELRWELEVHLGSSRIFRTSQLPSSRMQPVRDSPFKATSLTISNFQSTRITALLLHNSSAAKEAVQLLLLVFIHRPEPEFVIFAARSSVSHGNHQEGNPIP